MVKRHGTQTAWSGLTCSVLSDAYLRSLIVPAFSLHLYIYRCLSRKSGVFLLAEILVPSMGVGAVPEIFAADGPKITQRPPRPRAHSYSLGKGEQRSNLSS